jgi:putative ABC transport system substrate-binding protein
LRKVLPDLRSLAVLVNVANVRGGGRGGSRAAARMLGLDIITLEIRRAEEIEPALETLNGNAGAVYTRRAHFLLRISASTLSARLPTMHAAREFVEAGGLISYGASFPDIFRRAADYVDKILRGAKPGELPVEQPTKFDLVLNQTTAKALKLVTIQSVKVRLIESIHDCLVAVLPISTQTILLM